MNTKQLAKYGSVILSVAGTIAIGVGVHMARKAKKTINNVNKSIDDLADKTSVEISEAIIEKAAEKVAEKAASEAVETVRKDINLRVRNTVSAMYDDVEDKVHMQLTKAVEKDIDMDELKKEVEVRASSAIVSKFMDNLTDYVGPISAGIVNAINKEKQR